MEEKIVEWKKLYTFVYKTTVAGVDYFFKTLTRDDYADILTIQASTRDPRAFDHDLEVCKKCILSDYDEVVISKKAGIAVVIAEKIMLYSGFEAADVTEL
ncbi:MAG: hypothetical protein M0R17_05525 [Candidatus Omnitrophica bacterium]|jgi:hypothetical protein|nr:hypothetical protein [Candidatus Omnitrophota bacterium]